MSRVKYVPFLAALLLTACVQPQMQTPHVTEGELAQERQIQAQYVSDEQLRKQENRLKTRLEMQQRLNRIFTPIARAGARICTQLNAAGTSPGTCVFQAALSDPGENKTESSGVDTREVNAYADGEKIIINESMLRFAHDDNELAFVLSHELSHNILRHPESTQTNAIAGGVVGLLLDGLAASQGYNTQGGFTELGMQQALLTYSAQFEAEADYVGMYIMASAGYDYLGAANFWRRMSVRAPQAIYLGTTHPSNPERFVAMQKTAVEILEKKRRGQPLLPALRQPEPRSM